MKYEDFLKAQKCFSKLNRRTLIIKVILQGILLMEYVVRLPLECYWYCALLQMLFLIWKVYDMFTLKLGNIDLYCYKTKNNDRMRGFLLPFVFMNIISKPAFFLLHHVVYYTF